MTAPSAKETVVPLNDKRSDETDTTHAAPATASATASATDADLGQRLASVQDLLFGDAQRDIVQRLDTNDANHREFADDTAAQIAMMTEVFEQKIETLRQEIRSIDRAQTAKRRKLVGEMGDAIKAMAYDA